MSYRVTIRLTLRIRPARNLALGQEWHINACAGVVANLPPTGVESDSPGSRSALWEWPPECLIFPNGVASGGAGR